MWFGKKHKIMLKKCPLLKTKFELNIKTVEWIEINDTVAFGIWMYLKKCMCFQMKIKHIPALMVYHFINGVPWTVDVRC